MGLAEQLANENLSQRKQTIQCAPPQSINFPRSATQFNQVTVFNYGLLVPAPGTYDGTSVFFRNARDPGNAVANLEYIQGKAGVCPLLASGQWFVNAQTNIAAGTWRGVLYDFPEPSAVLAMMNALAANVSGTRVYGGAANATVTGADTAIVGANNARNGLFIANSGTTDGTTPTTSILWLSFGAAAAVVGSGVPLVAGSGLAWDTTTGITTQPVRGISTSGNIRVGVQEGI